MPKKGKGNNEVIQRVIARQEVFTQSAEVFSVGSPRKSLSTVKIEAQRMIGQVPGLLNRWFA
jgi:hypothetical protein